VSATDAAQVLAIGRTPLYEVVKSGDLTPINIRRCVRFSMYEITQYVESVTTLGERVTCELGNRLALALGSLRRLIALLGIETERNPRRVLRLASQ
jgi:predicted DNA-binding transcriptional regulator AlpA